MICHPFLIFFTPRHISAGQPKTFLLFLTIQHYSLIAEFQFFCRNDRSTFLWNKHWKFVAFWMHLPVRDAALCHIALYMSHNFCGLTDHATPYSGHFVATLGRGERMLGLSPSNVLTVGRSRAAVWRRFKQFLQAHPVSETWKAKPAPLAALTMVWSVW